MISEEKHALIVEDDPMFQLALRSAVKRFGFTPTVLKSENDFIINAKSIGAALVLVDVYFGSQPHGLNLVKQYRDEVNKTTPVFVITGSDDIDIFQSAILNGATECLRKSIDQTHLALQISKHMMTNALAKIVDYTHTVKKQKIDRPVLSELIIDATIARVDEYSIWIESSHQFLKGTVLKLEGEFLNILTEMTTILLVEVYSSDFDPIKSKYKTCLMIDRDDVQVLRSIRKWLFLKSKTISN